jgi:hypothetical protein
MGYCSHDSYLPGIQCQVKDLAAATETKLKMIIKWRWWVVVHSYVVVMQASGTEVTRDT